MEAQSEPRVAPVSSNVGRAVETSTEGGEGCTYTCLQHLGGSQEPEVHGLGSCTQNHTRIPGGHGKDVQVSIPQEGRGAWPRD